MMNIREFAVISAAVLAAGFTVAALPQKLNLRERDKLVEELTAKAKDAPKPADRAIAQYDLLRLNTLVCEDKDLPAAEKALDDFILKPGLEPKDYVNFLYFNVGRDYPLRRTELMKLAEKSALASTNAADHAAFYDMTLARFGARDWGQSDEPEYSPEAQLALAEKAEKDPLMKGNRWLSVWKSSALCECGRFAEAEKTLQDALAATDVVDVKLTLADRLATFYEDRAVRFYSVPDPAMLKKAVNMLEYKNSLYKNGDARTRGKVISLLITLEDWAAARQWVEADTALQKDRKPTEASLRALGDIAYGEKNWAEAARCYEQCTPEKYDWMTLHKMSKALYAAGNTNTLSYLETALKKCSNRYEKPHLEFEIDRLKR